MGAIYITYKTYFEEHMRAAASVDFRLELRKSGIRVNDAVLG